MTAPAVSANVTSVVPLLTVSGMERSLAFYVDGLGFAVQNRWEPDGKLRWCWMSLGGASLMLQEGVESTPEKLAATGTLGNGVSIWFQCRDALAVYREAEARGIAALREPQVGNSSWEIAFADPDGYRINFSSPTDLPEETLLSETGL